MLAGSKETWLSEELSDGDSSNDGPGPGSCMTTSGGSSGKDIMESDACSKMC